ncbi:MAG: recombinase RecF, partial [Clostridium sporogenes]|nr:recombinase RecF [Clostridium sporogenes]
RKRGIVSGIKSLEEQLLDSSKISEEVLKEKDKLYSLKSKLRDMEHKANMEADKPKRKLENKLNDLRMDMKQIEYTLNSLQREKQDIENNINHYTLLCDKAREKWFEENKSAFEFDESNCICPTCKRPFDTEDVENKKNQLEENFNSNKAKILKDIQDKGKSYKNLLEKYKETLDKTIANLKASSRDLEKLKLEESKLQEEINNFKPIDPLIDNGEYQELSLVANELEAKLQQPITVNNQVQELKERKSKLEFELEEVNGQLTYKEQNEKLKNRIQELQEEEKKLAQQIAQLEGQEFLCEEFIKTKVELLESSINAKFKYVSFKLLDTQVNGGLDETCEALINGVPFSNANTASQINAGLDIINALSEHYSVQAPIFIDNRESVNNLIETNSQIINLTVSEDKDLRIENQIDILEESKKIAEQLEKNK